MSREAYESCRSGHAASDEYLIAAIGVHPSASLVFYFFSVQLGWDTVGLLLAAISSCLLWGLLPLPSNLKTVEKWISTELTSPHLGNGGTRVVFRTDRSKVEIEKGCPDDEYSSLGDE